MATPPISLTGNWTDLHAAIAAAEGAPLLVYVDGGNAAFALNGGVMPGNLEYECEAYQGEQVQIGGRANGVAYGRATSGGRASVRVQVDAEGSVRKIPWSDSRVLDGGKAITAQSFVERHVKQGRQYEAAFYAAEVGAGATSDIAIQVGSSAGMTVRTLNIQFDSAMISTQVFRDPAFTGGTSLGVYNFNDAQAVAPDVTVLGDVTATDPGTPVGPRIYTIGTPNQGSRAFTSLTADPNVDRIFEAGTTYLFRVTNEDDTDPTQLSGVATWYQGPLSTELP